MRTLIAFLLAAGLFAAEVKTGVPAKNIQVLRFKSEALGEERFASVLLPADYEKSFRRYPTLYLLHGLGDDHTSWSYMTNLSGYAAAKDIIIVMPDAGRSFYVNSAADPKAKFEDFIAKDLVAFMDSHFRTIPLPRARALAGLSMGGYGAALIGLKHYRRFAAFASFSGAVGIAHDMPRTPAHAEAARRTAPMQALFGPANSPERAARDPFALLEKTPAAEMPGIYIACGAQDFLLAQNREFVRLLAEKKIPYEYREVSPRAHTWDFWDDQVKVFLDMLAKRWE
ncbi:MAG: alpha/beta hydrolase [Bryobacteraceae bacterium]